MMWRGRDRSQLVIMVVAWIIGVIMLAIVVGEMKRLGMEVHIL